MDDAVPHVQRRREGAGGEGVGRALADLAVARAGRDGCRGQGDRGDQRSRGQRRLHVRGVADGRVELGQRQLTGTVHGLVGDHRVERGQRHAHVGRVGRDAVVAPAEDRVVVVLALDRGAAAAGNPLVARPRGVGEVAAPGALQQVPADGRHVAELPGRTRQHRLGQRREAAPDLGVHGQVAVGGGRADDQAAVGGDLDAAQREAAHVDQQVGSLHTGLHQVDQVGAAAQETGLGTAREQRDGLLDPGRAAVGELLHAVTFVSSEARATARTIAV